MYGAVDAPTPQPFPVGASGRDFPAVRGVPESSHTARLSPSIEHRAAVVGDVDAGMVSAAGYVWLGEPMHRVSIPGLCTHLTAVPVLKVNGGE